MTTAPAETDLSPLIAAERRDLAAFLAARPDEAWETPSLCAGWRVREVVAHMTMPFRYTMQQYLDELAASGGDFTAMSDRCAKRDAAAPPADLLAALRDNADNPWQPPGGGLIGALTHDVIHGLDFTVPLTAGHPGAGRVVPAERLVAVLQSVTGPALANFGTDLSGIELRATDLDWSFGAGQPLAGQAQDLLLVIAGRSLPPGHLSGEPADRFTR
ncbi:MAG TPA: maleylpyruvate isomerase family mycothiol-dependent enzyme [Streptosporangiaceae bacterium]